MKYYFGKLFYHKSKKNKLVIFWKGFRLPACAYHARMGCNFEIMVLNMNFVVYFGEWIFR